jgi:hypothetical protein
VAFASRFPDDENGDVLRRMEAAGVDLISPRVMDFEHCFPDEASARAFRGAVQGTVLEARLIPAEPHEGAGWKVQCRQRMIPTHAAITETERRLGAITSPPNSVGTPMAGER